VVWTFDGGEIAFWNRGLMAILDPVEMITLDYEKGLAALEKAASLPAGRDSDPCAPGVEPAEDGGADGPISRDADV